MTQKTSLPVTLSSVGFGAYQIGRIASEKYASFGKPMPSDMEAESLLNGVLDLGITLIDTAPAYGVSEERIGKYLQERRNEYNLCTKVGELSIYGKCVFDFSAEGMRRSVERSLRTLRTDCIDILLIHAPPDDMCVLTDSDAVETMLSMQQEGKARYVGFSGKSAEAQLLSLEWSDVVMVEYSFANQRNASVIQEADNQGIIVLVKKAMNSGHLSGDEAIDFLIKKSPIQEALHCTVIGSTSLARMEENVRAFRVEG